jgi:predicted nucleic-acid-binding protein
VRIAADTNVLVRAIVIDDTKQARAAQSMLKDAEVVAITPSALREFVWVLSSIYRIPKAEIARAVRQLIDGANVSTNRAAVEAGVAALVAGGDFADGVIAFEGASLGGDTFASFDKEAVALLKKQGQAALLLQ